MSKRGWVGVGWGGGALRRGTQVTDIEKTRRWPSSCHLRQPCLVCCRRVCCLRVGLLLCVYHVGCTHCSRIFAFLSGILRLLVQCPPHPPRTVFSTISTNPWDQQQQQLLLKYLAASHASLPRWVVTKLGKALVDVGKVSWPQEDSDFLTDLMQLARYIRSGGPAVAVAGSHTPSSPLASRFLLSGRAPRLVSECFLLLFGSLRAPF